MFTLINSYAVPNRLLQAYNKASNILNTYIPLKKDIRIYLGNNLNGASRYGNCKWNTCNMPMEIQINPKIQDDEDLLNTLIHELLHAMTPGEGHKGNWKLYADIISNKTPYNITRCSQKELVGGFNFKYEAHCPTCNKVIGRARKITNWVKHPEDYHCPHCKGDIRVVNIG